MGVSFFYFNRSWRISSTTPNTDKIFLIIFKLIQQSITVILSCLARKNQNWIRGKKLILLLKAAFSRQKCLQTSLLSNKLNFFLEFKFWVFFARRLRMPIIACCISLKMIKKNLVVLGVVDMRQLLLSRATSEYCAY